MVNWPPRICVSLDKITVPEMNDFNVKRKLQFVSIFSKAICRIDTSCDIVYKTTMAFDGIKVCDIVYTTAMAFDGIKVSTAPSYFGPFNELKD